MPITTEPPAQPIPSGNARVNCTGVFGGSTWGNRFFVNIGNSVAPSDLPGFASAFFTAYAGHLLTGQCNLTTLTRVDVAYFDAGSEFNGSHIGSASGSGGVNGEPANVSAVVSWIQGAHYRGGHPRTYLPGVAAGNRADARSWLDASVSSWQTLANAFLAAVNAITVGSIVSTSLGTIHFFRGGVDLVPPVFDPYQGAHVQKRICTQRRRVGSEF